MGRDFYQSQGVPARSVASYQSGSGDRSGDEITGRRPHQGPDGFPGSTSISGLVKDHRGPGQIDLRVTDDLKTVVRILEDRRRVRESVGVSGGDFLGRGNGGFSKSCTAVVGDAEDFRYLRHRPAVAGRGEEEAGAAILVVGRVPGDASISGVEDD